MGTHFVVQLENQPGALARLARVLADAGVNIGEIGGSAAGSFGYANLTVDDSDRAAAVLCAHGYVHVDGEVLIVDVPDRTGGLADVAGRLGDAGVNIHAILFLGRSGGIVHTAMTVDDIAKARAALGMAAAPELPEPPGLPEPPELPEPPARPNA